MLGLTYLFDSEPIEPDELVILDDRLNHPMIRNVLERELPKQGLVWHGVMHTAIHIPQDAVAGSIKIGTLLKGYNYVSESLIDDLNEALSVFRIRAYNELWCITVGSVSEKNGNVWLRFDLARNSVYATWIKHV